MNYEQKEQLVNLDDDNFGQKTVKFSQEDKDDLLYFIIDTLRDTSKLSLLLQQGASARQFIGKERVMLWTVAFSRDLHHCETELHLPILIPYIFKNFTNNFKDECKTIIASSLRKYEAIMNRNSMTYNS